MGELAATLVDTLLPALPYRQWVFTYPHAPRRAMAQEPKLEHLIRYALRPPLAHTRLKRLPSGRIRYQLKRPWYDGSTTSNSTPWR